jgi:anaerobic magnesium-protoporphyrin IX monomethyl ester cyclase
MKVVLVSPPYPLEEGLSAPLGLCYVAAAFEKAGAEVKILDYIVRKYSPDRFLEEIAFFNPDIIGITSVTMNFAFAASIIKTAREGFPSAITIMGGPHVSFDYENTLKQYPEIDLIVIGEGEQTIAELLPVIRNREAWPGINGIAFRDSDTIVATQQRELINDLDSLSVPARHLLPISKYLALGFPISIITSRGCPNRCIFCQGRRMVGSRIRSRNPLRVVDEIEELLAYGFVRINFADDFFTSNSKRVKQICQEIRNRKLSFSWTVFARADSVNTELLTIMRDSGCDTVFFGIESGNQQMLDRVHKRVKLDRIRKAVADCKAVGMTVFGSFIVGLPGETIETMMDSHRFAKELDVIYGYHFLAPLPGTEIKECIDQYDLELLTDDWSLFDANRAIVRTSGLTPEEIEKFVDTFSIQPVRDMDLDTETRYREGKLSQQEQLIYFGKKKLDIIFKLLSEDIVETTDSIPITSDIAPEIQFSEYLTKRMDSHAEFILPSIQFLVKRGYLKYKIDNTRLFWYWP